MLDRDDQWDLEALDDAPNAGVLWPVLRKAGFIVAFSFMSFGGYYAFLGDGSGAKPGAQQVRQLPIASKPRPQPESRGYEMTIPAGANGHFVVNAMTNGRSVKFLVDTGATGIMLTEADAKKVGIQPASLTYSDRIQTANGQIPAARTTVREIRIGDLVVNDMEVWISRAPMSISLLGMTFLRKLESYEVRNDQLILRW